MRSFTTLDLQYAHRFYGFRGEAQYLHEHTGILTIEDDPLLPAILGVYEAQGIKNGTPTNKQKGPAFKTELATAYS